MTTTQKEKFKQKIWEKFNQDVLGGRGYLDTANGEGSIETIYAFLSETIDLCFAQMDMEKKLTQDIVNAWVIKGFAPDYHDRIKSQLKIMWPKLYYVIEMYVQFVQLKSGKENHEK